VNRSSKPCDEGDQLPVTPRSCPIDPCARIGYARPPRRYCAPEPDEFAGIASDPHGDDEIRDLTARVWRVPVAGTQGPINFA
jgi:hypothetical protein